MDFSKFPFDKHQCMFTLGVFGLPMTSARLEMRQLEYYQDKQRPLQYSVKFEFLAGDTCTLFSLSLY